MDADEKEIDSQPIDAQALTIKQPDELVLATAFLDSLIRNNRKIRQDRAEAIAEDAEVTYKRMVEDIELGIKRMKRERENMLDLAPDHAMSLIVASDFNAKDFVEKDIDLGVKIRNAEIKLEIAKKRYAWLFGGGE